MDETDPLSMLLLQNLTGGPDYKRPLFPSSLGEAFSNLGHGLAWYGGENLKRQLGIPYQDPTATALARAKLLEEMENAKLRREATAPFAGDISKALKPSTRVHYVPSGNVDEYGMPHVTPFEEEYYTEPQKLFAKVRLGMELKDTDPNKRIALEQSGLTRMEMADRMRSRTLGEQESRDIRRKADEARDREAKESLRLRREAAKMKVAEHGMSLEYPREAISKAMEAAINPETGELDTLKYWDALPERESPKALRVKKENEQKLKIMEGRNALLKERAATLLKGSKDHEWYRRYQGARQHWEQQYKMIIADPRNWEHLSKLIGAPPEPDDYYNLYHPISGASEGGSKPTAKPRPNPAGVAGQRFSSPVDKAAGTPDLDRTVNTLIFGVGPGEGGENKTRTPWRSSND